MVNFRLSIASGITTPVGLGSTELRASWPSRTHPISLEACQSWTRLSVQMTVGAEAHTSTSVSFMGSINVEGTSGAFELQLPKRDQPRQRRRGYG